MMTWAKGVLKKIDVFYGYKTNFRMRLSNLVHYGIEVRCRHGGSWCVKKIAKKNCRCLIRMVPYFSWFMSSHPSILLMSEATTKLVGLGRSESVVLDQKLIWLRLFGTGSVNSVREGRRLSPSVHKDPFCQDLVCSSTNDHIWIAVNNHWLL